MSATPISDRVRAKIAEAKASGSAKAATHATTAEFWLAEADRRREDFSGPRRVMQALEKALKAAEKAETFAKAGM